MDTERFPHRGHGSFLFPPESTATRRADAHDGQRENRALSTNEALEEPVVGPSGPGLRRRRPPLTVDLEFGIAGASDRAIELLMLDDAIDMLPEGKLASLVKKYIRIDDLRPDTVVGMSLLDRVRRFETESLAGKYFQEFDVNWKNCTKKSAGTTAWIATCRRLLDECVSAAPHGDPTEVRRAFDILFGLLDKIDEFRVDIIFFADEGGSWQVGVDWDRVLPSWFAVLAATAEPAVYAQRVGNLVDHHCGHKRDNVLAVAARAATPEQRAALAALPSGDRRRR